MVRIFNTTPRIVMGPGSVKTIGAEVKARGAKRVLIVTDKGVIGAGLLKSIEESFKSSKIIYAIFDKVEPDPRSPSRIKTVWGAGYMFVDEGTP